MPRGHASLADYYRAHRAAMELALATGCTPKEAERELRRQAKARRENCGRLAPPQNPQPEHEREQAQAPQPGADFAQWRAPWMMRD